MKISKLACFAYGIGAATLSFMTVDKLNENKIKAQIKETPGMTTEVMAEIEATVAKGSVNYQEALDVLKAREWAKRSYFEGAQAVRDSIKNAALKIKP